jgi:hypothetical protein
MPEEPREEYLLYVRVPNPEDETLEATNAFLERIAQLLTDDEAHIYVEPYLTYVEDRKKTEGTHGSRSGIKFEGVPHFKNSIDSTDKNSIRPLYFCHNKF